MLEKGPAYQFLLRLAFYYPGIERKRDERYFLSCQKNIGLYSWKYKFYDSKDNQIKDSKFFSLYTQYKNKGFEFQDVKKTQKNHVVIGNQNKNKVCFLNWKRYLFDFDGRYRHQNLIFVFDHSTRTFPTSNIFIKAATIANNEYLRYGKNFDINAFSTDWFVSKQKKWNSYW